MTPTELIASIREHRDETERLARDAAGQGHEYDWHADGDEVLTADDMVVVSGRPTEHIARHDPAAALRSVAADREIVDQASAMFHFAASQPDDRALQAMAAAYEDVLRARARGLDIDPASDPPVPRTAPTGDTT